MSRRDIEYEILGRLTRYMGSGRRLPSTKDGRVSVGGLVCVLDLPISDAQNFYRKRGIKTVVNALATKQGLRPMGKATESG